MSERTTPVAKKPKLDGVENKVAAPPGSGGGGGGEPKIDTEFDDAVIELEMCQNELDKLNEKENEEVIAMDMRYRKQRQELYDKRSKIIEKIPDFWFTVFTGHPDLCSMLTEEEENCLHHLKKVEVVLCDNTSGYTIHFYFAENPHFRNSVLSKEISYKADAVTATCTTIDWIKVPPSMKGRTGGKNANNSVAGATNKRPRDMPDTFFQWFSSNEDPANDKVAEMIKDDVWTNCLQYYLPDPDLEGEEESNDSSEVEEDDDDEEEEEEDGTADGEEEANGAGGRGAAGKDDEDDDEDEDDEDEGDDE